MILIVFSKLTFLKNSFRNTISIRVSNSCLDPDQEQHSVDPVLGPNCLQKLSADKKVTTSKERVESYIVAIPIGFRLVRLKKTM